MCFPGGGLLISLWLNTPLTMFGVRRMCSEPVESVNTLPSSAKRCPAK